MLKDAQILRNYLANNDITQGDLAKKLDMTRQNLVYHLSKDKFKPDFKEKLLDIGINIFEITNEKLHNNEVKPIPFENYMEVKYYPVIAQAGQLIGFSEETKETETMLVPKEFEKGNYIVVEIDGDSMNDGTDRSISDGDKILIKEIDLSQFNNNQINIKRSLFVLVYSCSESSGMICKQVTKIDSDTFTIHSWNKNFNDEVLKKEYLLQVFAVKKIVEKRIRF